jgi:hypothetical protein
MNAYWSIACGACPSCRFISDKLPYAEFLNIIKVLYHAHFVFSPISRVQVNEIAAGKIIAFETIFCFTIRGKFHFHFLR